MPLVELYGHDELKARLARSAAAGTLPASLLLHGPRGTGKQRLALWLGQLLVCESDSPPCGACQACRYAREGAHPDIHWYFPRPRPKDSDPDLDDVRDDYREAIAARLANAGLYPAPSGSEGIFVATVRAIVQEAARTPAMGKRKVFILGDADRMVPQEGSDQAANAFLKLLEEPPMNTTIILTTSEPGTLLPTIRSRTAAVRVPPLAEPAMQAFLADPAVDAALEELAPGRSAGEWMRLAEGTPGVMFGDDARGRAMGAAKRLLDAAVSPQASQLYAAAVASGVSGARGSFADVLDSVLVILGERMRAALHDGDQHRALAVSRAADHVGRARALANNNVSPQLIAADLMLTLSATLR